MQTNTQATASTLWPLFFRTHHHSSPFSLKALYHMGFRVVTSDPTRNHLATCHHACSTNGHTEWFSECRARLERPAIDFIAVANN